MDFFHKFCELTTAVKREKTSVLPVSAGEKKGTGGWAEKNLFFVVDYFYITTSHNITKQS